MTAHEPIDVHSAAGDAQDSNYHILQDDELVALWLLGLITSVRGALASLIVWRTIRR